MRSFEQTPSEIWLDDRIEAYLDGDLPAGEAEKVEQMLADDEEWLAEIHLAQQIRDELRSQPKPVCPPEVTRHVFSEVRRLAFVSWKDRFRMWADRWWVEWWQPTLAMSLLVLVIVSASLLGGLSPTHSQKTETMEVQTALAEAKWTLAYLSQVGRNAGQSVRHDVLRDRVVAPMQNAIESILENPEQN